MNVMMRVNFMDEKKLAINVPLFKKLRDIIFFAGQSLYESFLRDILRGPRLF